MQDDESFLSDVMRAVSEKQWITEGISYKMADLVWPNAGLVIWLDLPLQTIWRRVFWRSFTRLVRGGTKPSGHSVNFSSKFGEKGIVRNMHKIYANIHEQYPNMFTEIGEGNMNLITFRSKGELNQWLKSLG